MKKMTRSFQKMKKDMKRKMLRPLQIICWCASFKTIIQPSPQVDPDEVEFSRLGKARDNTESEDESEKEAQATKVNTVQKDICSFLVGILLSLLASRNHNNKTCGI